MPVRRSTKGHLSRRALLLATAAAGGSITLASCGAAPPVPLELSRLREAPPTPALPTPTTPALSAPTPPPQPLTAVPSVVPPAPTATPEIPTATLTPTTPAPTPEPTSPPPAASPAASPTVSPPTILDVPYYTQHIGLKNYCFPSSIAMVADYYGALDPTAAGTRAAAPIWVVEKAVPKAEARVEELSPAARAALAKDTDVENPLAPDLWGLTKQSNGGIGGMYSSVGYMVLKYGLGLNATFGTWEDCLAALKEGAPSILTGPYGVLVRRDGQPLYPFTAPHALVLVGVERDIAYVNDPLSLDKKPYSGQRGLASARDRAVRFDLASVAKMARAGSGSSKSLIIVRKADSTQS